MVASLILRQAESCVKDLQLIYDARIMHHILFYNVDKDNGKHIKWPAGEK